MGREGSRWKRLLTGDSCASTFQSRIYLFGLFLDAMNHSNQQRIGFECLNSHHVAHEHNTNKDKDGQASDVQVSGDGLGESRCIKQLFKKKKNTAFRS